MDKKKIELRIKSRGLTRNERKIVYKEVKQAIDKIRYERKRTCMDSPSYLINLK